MSVVGPEVGPDLGPDVGPDLGPDVGPDYGAEMMGEEVYVDAGDAGVADLPSDAPAGTGQAPSIVCNLLGTVPQEPVITPQGYIFEKRAIEAYLEATGKTCPVCKKELKAEDLRKINVPATQKPMCPNPTSIANLLNLLRNDVDTALLENFATRQENKGLKEELATTLYTEDAAVRLLAQYKRDNTQLKEQNQKMVEEAEKLRQKAAMAGSGGGGGMGMDGMGGFGGMGGMGGMGEDLPNYATPEFMKYAGLEEEKFRANRAAEKETKKAKKKAGETVEEEGDIDAREIAGFSVTTSVPMHSTTVKGIRCMAVHPVHGDMLVTGGMDGSVIIFHKRKRRQIDVLKSSLKDPKPITALGVFEDIIVSGSLDGTVSFFRAQNADWERGYVKTLSLKLHKREVTSISVHPSLGHVLTTSKDKTWSLLDVQEGRVLCQNTDSAVEITSSDWHPGGGLFMIARADGTAELFACNKENPEDLQENVVIADAPEEHLHDPIRAMRFHQNCTTLVSASKSVVCLHDIRKSTLLQKLPFASKKVNNVRLCGPNSKYLLVFADALHVYVQEGKEYGLVKTFPDHSDLVMDGAMFDGNVVSCGLDRELKIYG